MQPLRAAALAAAIGLPLPRLSRSRSQRMKMKSASSSPRGPRPSTGHADRAASSMHLRNATLVTVRGEMTEGQAAIEKGLTSIFETRARNATLRTLNVEIRLLRPDIALAHVTNELSGVVAPDGQPRPPQRELSLGVFTKQAGHRKLAAFHDTMIRPLAGTSR